MSDPPDTLRHARHAIANTVQMIKLRLHAAKSMTDGPDRQQMISEAEDELGTLQGQLDNLFRDIL